MCAIKELSVGNYNINSAPYDLQFYTEEKLSEAGHELNSCVKQVNHESGGSNSPR